MNKIKIMTKIKTILRTISLTKWYQENCTYIGTTQLTELK